MQPKFPNISKAEWLAKVEKDLKGKPLDGLNWEVGGKMFSPFWHGEDLIEQYVPIRRTASCLLGVKIHVNDPKEANQLALEALSGGANYIYFLQEQTEQINEDYRAELFAGILTDIVEVVWHTSPKPFFTYTRENVATWLTLCILGLPLTLWLELSGDYFQDIATLRAVRLCANLITELTKEDPVFKIGIIVKGDSSDPNTAKIRSTAKAMAAMMGGADILLIEPADGQGHNAFERRIARNILHILTEEAHLHQVSDPAAGSYYIESLTNTIAEEIWAKFQKLSANG